MGVLVLVLGSHLSKRDLVSDLGCVAQPWVWQGLCWLLDCSSLRLVPGYSSRASKCAWLPVLRVS